MIDVEYLNRLTKLENERLRILNTTTIEQRVNKMKKFLDALSTFGKENFPAKNLLMERMCELLK